jgi:RNA polymerase sigma factor (sigma-70 family)
MSAWSLSPLVPLGLPRATSRRVVAGDRSPTSARWQRDERLASSGPPSSGEPLPTLAQGPHLDVASIVLAALAADQRASPPTTRSAYLVESDDDSVRAVTPLRPAQVLDPEKLAERERERAEVERAQAGDRAALGSLLRRHGPMLYRAVLLPRLGNQAAAEEALSVVYAKVIERIHQFTWQSVGVYPWLRMVAMRVALDQLRARKREMPLDVDDLQREVDRADRTSDHGTDAPTLAREDAENAKRRIELALSQLHPRYALTIRRRLLDEQPREAVAAELGVTVATFDVVLHRAMAALKKALAETAEEAPPSEGKAP